VARDAVEITELTVGDADVRGVDVAVDLPGDQTMRNLHFPQFVGDLHQFSQGSVFEKKYAFFLVEKILT